MVQTGRAEDYIFETSSVRYVLGDNGSNKSLQDKKTGRQLLADTITPFASVRKGGQFFPATSIRRQHDLLQVDFGPARVTASYRISAKEDYVLIELVHLSGESVEEIRLVQLHAGGLPTIGSLLNVAWDDRNAVCLMGLSDRVDSRPGYGMLLSSLYPSFGMDGEKVALIATATARFMRAVQTIEKDLHLPSPSIEGTWAKASADVKSSYLFTDLTEGNADETLAYAKKGGFKYILIYARTWSSSLGSYPIDTRNYPRGEASLKDVIDKCHAAGLKVGMHMLTSFIDKKDPLVRGESKRLLLGDAEAALSADTAETETAIVAAGTLTHFPGSGHYGPSKEVRIDDEIIHYESVGGVGTATLMQCTRGYAGTRPGLHKAGAKIYHLAERENAYLADLATTLKDDIADRIAGLINRCGFDMIYFDGGEVNGANGPYWYWAGQQQTAVWKRVKRDLLVQGSGMTHWTWHIFARGTSDDYAAVAPKQFLDLHKIPDYWQFHAANFMPAELGWWGFLTSAPDHQATKPDDIAFYGTRMLALNSPVSLETNLAALKANGRTNEMLTLLGEYNQLLLKDTVPLPLRERLKTGEWHMVRSTGRTAFQPIHVETKRPDAAGEIMVNNVYSDQTPGVRITAVSSLSKAGDPLNIPLLPDISPLDLDPPRHDQAMPGALINRIESNRGVSDRSSETPVGLPAKNRSLDLTEHRALAVRLKVDGLTSISAGRYPVLNVQLESSNGTYRDYYINLDFTGERTIIIPETATSGCFPSFDPLKRTIRSKRPCIRILTIAASLP